MAKNSSLIHQTYQKLPSKTVTAQAYSLQVEYYRLSGRLSFGVLIYTHLSHRTQ